MNAGAKDPFLIRWPVVVCWLPPPPRASIIRAPAARPEVLEARTRVGLSQAKFAEVLGVSTRTLQDWEQGRRKPSGAARSLLKIARKRPEVLREVFAA
jgi:putative transcriptional regulator